MKSIVNAKKKNSRRYGQNLWGDANSPILKRNYAPGQHGQRRKKTTDYGEQLYAKQRLKVYYGNTYVIPDQVYVGEIQNRPAGIQT